LHILMMPSWYKTPETPVDGTYIEEQARALQKEGHRIGIIFPQYTPPSEIFSGKVQEVTDFYVDDDIPTLHVKNFAGIPKLRRLSYRQLGKSVNKIYQEYVDTFGRPDVIHAHSVFHAGIAGFYIAKINKVPFVITEHLPDYMMGYIRNSIDLEVAREIFDYADCAITVSNTFRNDLEKLLKLEEHQLKLIPNLINEIFLDSFTPQEYPSNEPFRFFTNGFLIPRKNIQLGLDALKILIDNNKNVHFTIGGDGELEQTLREYVVYLGLNNHVHFTGQLSRQQVKRELDKCHAFLLTSRYESFGIAILESLACGRPVVISDSTGPRGYVRTEDGLVVSDHEPRSIADAMEKMMDNYSNYDQNGIRTNSMMLFSHQNIARDLTDVYQNVMAKRIAYST